MTNLDGWKIGIFYDKNQWRCRLKLAHRQSFWKYAPSMFGMPLITKMKNPDLISSLPLQEKFASQKALNWKAWVKFQIILVSWGIFGNNFKRCRRRVEAEASQLLKRWSSFLKKQFQKVCNCWGIFWGIVEELFKQVFIKGGNLSKILGLTVIFYCE